MPDNSVRWSITRKTPYGVLLANTFYGSTNNVTSFELSSIIAHFRRKSNEKTKSERKSLDMASGGQNSHKSAGGRTVQHILSAGTYS